MLLLFLNKGDGSMNEWFAKVVSDFSGAFIEGDRKSEAKRS